MFIQNGHRSRILEGKKREDTHDKVDYMMVFGSDIGSEYSKYIRGNSVSIGSLKNNHYPKSQSKALGTIAFISQYSDFESAIVGGKLFTHNQFYQADKIVLENLLKYADKYGRRFLIIPAHGFENSILIKEKEFYSDLLGQSVSYYDPREFGSSYYNTDEAEVVVGVSSTLLYESIARGNKTAIFPLRGQLLDAKDHTYGWPGEYVDDGPFWTNHPNPENFERIMDHLFEINDAQWHAELAEYSFDKVMTYDSGNGILKTILTKELGSRPTG